MRKHLPTLLGHDALLEEQTLEMATLRAARSDRHAMKGDRPPKRYRLGPEKPDGTLPIDVADGGADNWREMETCPNADLAQNESSVDRGEFTMTRTRLLAISAAFVVLVTPVIRAQETPGVSAQDLSSTGSFNSA